MANNINQSSLTATTNRPNVGFKVGLQSTINTMITSGANAHAAPGTFYLTGDTHRLYIGNDNGSISPVNSGVITVATLGDLPNMDAASADVKAATAGNFYYVTGSNILCVYSASNQNGQEKGGWVQINPNTDNKVADFEQAVSVSNGVATITSTLTQGEQGVEDQNLTKEDSITVQGAGGAKVSGTSSGITITGEQYTLGSSLSGSTATIGLTPSSGFNDGSSFTLTAGNNVQLTGNSNALTIAATDTINEVVAATLDPVANNGNGFKLTVTTSNGQGGNTDVSEEDTIDPIITNGDDDGFTAHFVGGTATLDVYSKDQIDEIMRGVDAMHYRGTMGAGGSILDQGDIIVSDSLLTNNNFSVGDTYKLAGITNIGTSAGSLVEYPAGSIVIVRGTEDEDTGLIESGLIFDVISGSTEKDTKYQFNDVSDTTSASSTYEGIKMVEQQNQSSQVGELRIAEGTAIDVTGSFSSGVKTVTVNHADVGPVNKQTTATAESQNIADDTTLSVVKSVTVNAQGHVTDVKTVQVTLNDSDTVLTSADLSATAVTGGVSIGSTVSGQNSMNSALTTTTSSGDALTIKSDSIQVAVDSSTGANGIVMNMVWGSF